MTAWPSDIPEPKCSTLDGGWSYNPISNAIPIDVESGEPLSRARFTGDQIDFTGTLPPLTRDQAQDLYDFWKTTLQDGSLRFTATDPFTLSSADMMFLTPPTFTRNGTRKWTASLRLRILP